MKKIISSTTLAFVFMAVACVKNQSVLNCGKLPCPTAKGANVVSCYINGVPYIAKGDRPTLGMFSVCEQGCDFTNVVAPGQFTSLEFFFCDKTISRTGFVNQIQIDIRDSLKVGTYQLNEGTPAIARLSGALDFNGQTDSVELGVLQITTLTEKVIAGKFSFKVSHGSAINNVTEGNFDIGR
jgi:hypothetical protein